MNNVRFERKKTNFFFIYNYSLFKIGRAARECGKAYHYGGLQDFVGQGPPWSFCRFLDKIGVST